jgi:hypothetical protein
LRKPKPKPRKPKTANTGAVAKKATKSVVKTPKRR